jgi:hypothetical protein
MDERKNGLGAAGRQLVAADAAEPETPEGEAARLEERAGAIRDSLTGLVDELDHRRQSVAWRVAKPIVIVAGLALAVVLGRLWWRGRGLGRILRLP